jgi:catechol 2,3-dioxygenase-like lactoylglutathione lyase family enzyme
VRGGLSLENALPQEILMIDHVGFPVSDYERAKTFYLKALAPLGYSLVMEVTQEQTGHDPAAGFGANGKPDFWIGGEGGLNKPLHVAIIAQDRTTVDAFYKAAMAAGGRDNGAPGIRAHYHPNYYGAFVLIPTAITSKRCATRRSNRFQLTSMPNLQGSKRISILGIAGMPGGQCRTTI